MDDEAVSILTFDSMGEWNDEPCVIAFDDITQAQFDTPYINTFSKYLKPPPGLGLDSTSS